MTLLRRTRFHAVGDICMGASQETYFEGFDAEMNQQNKKLSAIPNSWLTRTLVDRQGTRYIPGKENPCHVDDGLQDIRYDIIMNLILRLTRQKKNIFHHSQAGTHHP